MSVDNAMYVWIKDKTVMDNISNVQNLAHQLSNLNQPVNEINLITKILTILPPEY